MCKALDEMRARERQEEKQRAARRMLLDGSLSLEKIAEYADLSLEEVKQLQAEKSA